MTAPADSTPAAAPTPAQLEADARAERAAFTEAQNRKAAGLVIEQIARREPAVRALARENTDLQAIVAELRAQLAAAREAHAEALGELDRCNDELAKVRAELTAALKPRR